MRWARVSATIPVPVSLTSSFTYDPGSRPKQAQLECSSRLTSAASIKNRGVEIGIWRRESCPLTYGAIQYFANLECESIRCERLLQESRARIQQTVVNDSIFHIPGHAENFRFRMK